MFDVSGCFLDKTPPGTARRKSKLRRRFVDSVSSRPSPCGLRSSN